MHISYILNELAEDRSQYFNAIAPPIVQTSNFAFLDFETMRTAFEDEFAGDYLYTKSRNPTVDMLRQKLAALEGAEDAIVLNSGSSAIFVSMLANVKMGDHIVSVAKPYTWAQRMLEKILPRFGVTHTYVDGTQVENFERAIQPNTTLIYLESPNSWTFELQDLRAVADLAKRHGIVTVIDNSYATPLYQQPHALGIDLCLHSATKYIGGHSDTVAGLLTGSKTLIKKMFDSELLNSGTSIQPFNAWLLIRGLRTLSIRIQRSTETTLKVVAFMKNHSKVERIYFPFDDSFSQYELAQQQMKGACGLFTVQLKATDYQQIERFSLALKHILLAVSWGGHESLIMPKCAGIKPEDFDATNPDHRLVRFYIGLEEADYLIEDLQQALEQL